MKKKTKVILAILIILLILLIIFIFVLGKDKNLKVEFNTDGGSNISEIEVEKDGTLKLPEAPTKEGFIFAGWVNEKGELINREIKVTENTSIKALWIEKDKQTYTISFSTEGDIDYTDTIVEQGKYIVLPIPPEREGYIFVGWINESGNVVNNKYVINTNTKLTAKWISKDSKTITITFNTDGGNNVGDIIIENGQVISFPTTPVKEGYVFAGWVDQNGKTIKVGTKVSENTTLKATWKTAVECPKNCTPSKDGKSCTTTKTTDMVTKTTCPSGSKLINGNCLDVKNQYHATSVDYSPWWACNSSSEVMYSEIDESGLGAFMWCAKKVQKQTSKGCPSGYTQKDNKCVMTKTQKCTVNKPVEYIVK